jgi:hypothetical protein
MSHAEPHRWDVSLVHANTGATIPDPQAYGPAPVQASGIVMQSVSLRVNGTLRQLAVFALAGGEPEGRRLAR